MYGKRKSECLKRFQASPVVLVVKNLPSNAGDTKDTWVHPLEKGMATHSSILAWKFPWTEEPGRLQYLGPAESGTRLSWLNTHTRAFKTLHLWLSDSPKVYLHSTKHVPVSVSAWQIITHLILLMFLWSLWSHIIPTLKKVRAKGLCSRLYTED